MQELSQPVAKFSGIFDDVLKGLGAGLSVFKAIGGGSSGSKTPAVPCLGAGDIDKIVAAYHDLETSTNHDPAQLLPASQQILSSLQAAKPCQGNEAYTSQAITDFQHNNAVLQATVTAGTPTMTINPVTGLPTVTTATPTITIAGATIPTNYLLYGGIGLIGLMFVMNMNKK